MAVEDLEDDHGAVHDLAVGLFLEVARLRGRDLVVDEDHLGLLREAAQFFALAGAEVRGLVEVGALLRERADDLEAQRLGELAQLAQRGLELDVAHARELHGRHDGAPGLFPGFLHGARSLPDRAPFAAKTRTSARARFR